MKQLLACIVLIAGSVQGIAIPVTLNFDDITAGAGSSISNYGGVQISQANCCFVREIVNLSPLAIVIKLFKVLGKKQILLYILI